MVSGFLCFFFNNNSFLTLVRKKWKQKNIIFVRAPHVYSGTVIVPRSCMNYRLTEVGAPLKHPVVVTVLDPEKGVCADPVDKGAILGRGGGADS